MPAPSVKTRFAPSPTGLLHLGNVRTALFSALLARRSGGVFLLRIEDTDRARSTAAFTQALQEDLRWLGLDWQEGPGAEGAHGPYLQSERTEIYDRHAQALQSRGLAYPCFCTPLELESARKAQRAAGRPPRYAGTCAHLTPEQVQARLREGRAPTLRFRVPGDRTVIFEDLVRGPQSFACADIGDFIIKRADGSAAFFFSNAIDDGLMGVTHVLRGEDHLANTPRQILLLEALGLPVPRYGHLSMILARDGSPLSKRHGSRSVQELREAGYFRLAALNHLARLGHHYAEDAFMELDALTAGFDLTRLGRAPARHDDEQLDHWQACAIAQAPAAALCEWAGPQVQDLVPAEACERFIDLVRGNIRLPADARRWAMVLFGDECAPSPDAVREIVVAGTAFFMHAVAIPEAAARDYASFTAALKEATGKRGKALFMPLRAALTGEVHGPELAGIFGLLAPERLRARLESAAALARQSPLES